jgi:hypothetical protein
MLRIVLALLCTIFLVNCANNPFSSYKSRSDNMLNSLYTQHNHNSADTYGSTSHPDILFFMEYGTFLKLTDDYTQSNIQFNNAQLMIESWVNSWQNSTGGNVFNTGVKMIINDNATDYEPKGYEKTMLSTYKALNNINLGNSQYARIEIKRMYQTEQAIYNYNLALYNKEKNDTNNIKANSTESRLYSEILHKYNFSDINSPDVLALKNSYQVAYAHYLAGFIFEALKEPSLSRPGYLKAGQLAPLNKLPQQSIDNLDKGTTGKNGFSNVLIIEEVGHAPQIQSENLHFPFYTNINGRACPTNINVFFPKLIFDNQNNLGYNYQIDGNNIDQELFTNFDLMAARAIHDNISHIIMRNISAAVRNVSMSAISCTQGSSLLNLAGIVTGVLLDHADERTWVLLPSKVYLSRVQLPLGKHTLSIYINGNNIKKEINIDRPYQVINLRVVGNNLYM